MNLEQILDAFERDADFRAQVAHWERLPATPARYSELPEWLDGRITQAIRTRGIARLYAHQAAALDAAHARKHVVIATPPSSGKSLCIQLPVLDAIAKEPSARALLIFPTDSLAHDQLIEFGSLSTLAGIGLQARAPAHGKISPRDMDGPIQVVMTTPDVLHTAILPRHSEWAKFFEQLHCVVLDELHTYRGVFGSHVANVLRRLRRLCAFYDSHPVFICTSATIANPEELARKHIEDDVVVIDESGAPRGEKVIVFVNPPVVNASLGIRRSALLTGRDIAATLLASGVRTIAFARSRVQTELLLTYLQSRYPQPQWPSGLIRGGGGGYLPSERRALERGLRDGSVRGIVSTNTLEPGIEMGALQAAVLVGYPGTVASSLQQIGSVGRHDQLSAAFLVAASSPPDQYVVEHPGYLVGRPSESGLINPDNLHVLVDHLKCSAFELPFDQTERFGTEETSGVLSYLREQGILHEADGRYHWAAQAFPAEAMSLRTASNDNLVIIDTTGKTARVIGEIDRFAAQVLLHEQAIYLHESKQFQVERVDWDNAKAYVREVKVGYYTQAELAVRIRVIDEFDRRSAERAFDRAHGEVLVSTLATIFKKLTMYTHENVGWGKIHLPQQELQTTSFWCSLPERAVAGWPKERVEIALAGLGNLLHGLAPLFLMCDPHDLGLAVEMRSPHTERPTIHLFDMTPGGIGFAECLFRSHDALIDRAREHLASCGCTTGCPSCIGPAYVLGDDVREAVAQLLEAITGRALVTVARRSTPSLRTDRPETHRVIKEVTTGDVPSGKALPATRGHEGTSRVAFSSPSRMRVFISHSGSEDTVKEIAAQVERIGAEALFDGRIQVGEPLAATILEYIRKSSEFIVLLTPPALGSGWVWAEIGAGLARKQRIVGVLDGVSVAELQTQSGGQLLTGVRLVSLPEIQRYYDELAARIRERRR